MKFLKILGGAVIGVGAIAAAPFTGGGSVVGAVGLIASLSGAGTIALATGAGVAGAVAANKLASKEEEATQSKVDKVRTKYEMEKNKIKKQMEAILKEPSKMFDYVLAMYALGLSVAYADGTISDDEANSIDMAVAGFIAGDFPENVKRQIKEFKDDPPTITTAFEYLKKSGLTEEGWSKIDELIEIVITVDGHEAPGEKDFREAWKILRKAA